MEKIKILVLIVMIFNLYLAAIGNPVKIKNVTEQQLSEKQMMSSAIQLTTQRYRLGIILFHLKPFDHWCFQNIFEDVSLLKIV